MISLEDLFVALFSGLLILAFFLGPWIISIISLRKLSTLKKILERIDKDMSSLFAWLAEENRSAKQKKTTEAPAISRPEIAPEAMPKQEPVAVETPEILQPAIPAPVQPLPPPLPVPLPSPAAKTSADLPHPQHLAKSDEVEEPEEKTTPPPVDPRLPEEKAPSLAKKIWNWVLFGEENRTPDGNAERAAASTWLLRVGILALVLCAAYFLKWSIERGILGPEGRVAITVAAGAALLVFGERLIGKRYNIMGQGLMGTGIITLYFSALAGGPMLYGIFSSHSALALVVLVTVVAGVLAVRKDSMFSAIIGMAGGYLAPVLLKIPDTPLTGLYGYMLLLGLGIMSVSRYKNWHLLNLPALIVTYAVFAWSLQFYEKSDFPTAMIFLSLFFLLHVAQGNIRHVWLRAHASSPGLFYQILNTILYSSAGYGLIRHAHGRPFPALLALALAAFFTLHVYIFKSVQKHNKPLMTVWIGLASLFAAWTLPLTLEKESLTVGVALMALMFTWIGSRAPNQFLQHVGTALYLWLFIRLAMQWGDNYFLTPARFSGFAAYLRGFWPRLATYGISLLSIAAASWIYRGQSQLDSDTKDGKGLNAIPLKTAFAPALFWFAILFGFFAVYAESAVTLKFLMPARMPLLTALCCGMSMFFLHRLITGKSEASVMFIVMTIFIIATALKILIYDIPSWNLSPRWFFRGRHLFLDASMRLLDFGLILSAVLTVFAMFRQRPDFRSAAPAFGYAALAILFFYASLELNTLLYWKLPKFQRGGISMLWALFAVSYLVGGIRFRVATLRYLGLILFAVIAVKMFMFDLARLEMIFRVLALVGVGIALLLGSFAYLRWAPQETPAEPKENNQ